MSFELTILGSGAALPTARRNPTAQYINCNDRHILIDCGEGTQVQLRKYHVRIQKITHICISHLHGDHFFGLVGLLSSMHLLGRDQGITIYGPEELEQIVRIQLEIGGAQLGFSLNFVKLNGKEHRLIFEDRMIEIWTFPLKHRIPTNGFMVKEKTKERPLDGARFKKDQLSLAAIPFFKRGENFVDEDGRVHAFETYTFPPAMAKSYAYCSDTIYQESIVPYVSNVTVLYHEATFLHALIARANATYHSTAFQAAQLAKLAKVQRLFLGHLSARYDNGEQHLLEAKSVFKDVVVVEDGDVYNI